MEKLKPHHHFVKWGSLYTELSILECPICGEVLKNLKPVGFYLSVCKRCKKFWSLEVIDYSKYLTKDFKKNVIMEDDLNLLLTNLKDKLKQ